MKRVRVQEEGIMGDPPVQLIGGDQVLTTVVHAALCMIGMMDLPMTGARALIMVGLEALTTVGAGAPNMVDIAVVHQCEGQEHRSVAWYRHMKQVAMVL